MWLLLKCALVSGWDVKATFQQNIISVHPGATGTLNKLFLQTLLQKKVSQFFILYSISFEESFTACLSSHPFSCSGKNPVVQLHQHNCSVTFSNKLPLVKNDNLYVLSHASHVSWGTATHSVVTICRYNVHPCTYAVIKNTVPTSIYFIIRCITHISHSQCLNNYCKF